MAHNYYIQSGGEDKCFVAESNLLRDNEHDLMIYTVHNDAMRRMNGIKSAGVAIWNRESFNEITTLIQSGKPDVVHFHNVFPLMSPAVFWAAKKQGCAVVNTLHNYRLMCPAGTLVRNGRICEDCVGDSLPWPAILHGCYRNSRPASAAVASTLLTHRVLKTWAHKIDIFIVLSEFARQRFIASGISEAKIALKSNFVHPDPHPGGVCRNYALFVGRLSPEKGIDTLLAAWSKLAGNLELRIVGDGPLNSYVEAVSSQSERIEYLGHKQTADVMKLMSESQFLVMPSLCYETFGLAIIEAFANGKPVIVSRLGAMTELVEEGSTGLTFEAGNSDDLAAKVNWAIEHPEEMRTMGQKARGVYVENYTAERNYRQLIEIYETALTLARRERH